ncbi:hypothetical protein [Methylobacterium dankookense]|uniref:Uncharacterized protein n=1 Tax=Methylobacterium dankookense TaxID=560405 RepID=A0A564FXG6_9HYPH|nr:hypothetical protein [Methylobacterium dankookense]GJD55950.1 hypothetical protein IFDJLNFL_1842 [Methylobacterium dankookense]VUF12855.1 hypothetical protein MTDSW087_02550 [Methylobacterium dankookense]
MKNLTIAVLASLALTGTALAAEQRGASPNTPGHEMQDKGSRTGSPGASGYAPGHEMKSDTTGSTKGSTSGSGTMNKDMKGDTSGTRH